MSSTDTPRDKATSRHPRKGRVRAFHCRHVGAHFLVAADAHQVAAFKLNPEPISMIQFLDSDEVRGLAHDFDAISSSATAGFSGDLIEAMCEAHPSFDHESWRPTFLRETAENSGIAIPRSYPVPFPHSLASLLASLSPSHAKRLALCCKSPQAFHEELARIATEIGHPWPLIEEEDAFFSFPYSRASGIQRIMRPDSPVVPLELLNRLEWASDEVGPSIASVAWTIEDPPHEPLRGPLPFARHLYNADLFVDRQNHFGYARLSRDDDTVVMVDPGARGVVAINEAISFLCGAKRRVRPVAHTGSIHQHVLLALVERDAPKEPIAVASGSLIVRVRGKTVEATINLNGVYTTPSYRRNGRATQLVHELGATLGAHIASIRPHVSRLNLDICVSAPEHFGIPSLAEYFFDGCVMASPNDDLLPDLPWESVSEVVLEQSTEDLCGLNIGAGLVPAKSFTDDIERGNFHFDDWMEYVDLDGMDALFAPGPSIELRLPTGQPPHDIRGVARIERYPIKVRGLEVECHLEVHSLSQSDDPLGHDGRQIVRTERVFLVESARQTIIAEATVKNAFLFGWMTEGSADAGDIYDEMLSVCTAIFPSGGAPWAREIADAFCDRYETDRYRTEKQHHFSVLMEWESHSEKLSDMQWLQALSTFSTIVVIVPDDRKDAFSVRNALRSSGATPLHIRDEPYAAYLIMSPGDNRDHTRVVRSINPR